jgi:hypothetical protein
MRWQQPRCCKPAEYCSLETPSYCLYGQMNGYTIHRVLPDHEEVATTNRTKPGLFPVKRNRRCSRVIIVKKESRLVEAMLGSG